MPRELPARAGTVVPVAVPPLDVVVLPEFGVLLLAGSCDTEVTLLPAAVEGLVEPSVTKAPGLVGTEALGVGRYGVVVPRGGAMGGAAPVRTTESSALG